MSCSNLVRRQLINFSVHQTRLMNKDIGTTVQNVHGQKVEARKLVPDGDVIGVGKPILQSNAIDGQTSKQQTTSASTQTIQARPINPAISKEIKLFYFDTLKLASKFQNHGFTQEQAYCIVEAFIEVLNTSIEHQTKIMVSKPEQEIMVQQLMAQIGSVKKDMVILEKSEFTMLRNETEKQTAEIKLMKSLIKDEISKLQGNVKLDVNLERSRAAEAHAESETQLQILRNKIDTDVANLRTTYEQYRNDVMKFSTGIIVSSMAVGLGIMRLLSS